MASPASAPLRFAGDITGCHEYGTVPYRCSHSSLHLPSSEDYNRQRECAPFPGLSRATQPQNGPPEEGVLRPHVVEGAAFSMWASRPDDPAEAHMYPRAAATGEFTPLLLRVSERLQETKPSDVWTTCDTDRELPEASVCPRQNGVVVSKPVGYRGDAPEFHATEDSPSVAAGAVVQGEENAVPGGSWEALVASTLPPRRRSYLNLDPTSHMTIEFPVAATDVAYLRPVRHTPPSTQDQVQQQPNRELLSKECPGFIDENAERLNLPVGQFEQPRYDFSLEEVAATVPAIVEFSFESFEFIGKPTRAVENRIFITVYIEETEERMLPCRTESVPVDAEGFADFAGAGVQLLWRGEEFVYMKVYKENGNNLDEVVGHVKMQFESMHPGGAAMKVLTIGNQNEGNGYLILRLSLLPVTYDPAHYVAQRMSTTSQQPVSDSSKSACDEGFSTSEPVVCSNHTILRPQLSETTYSTTAAIQSPVLQTNSDSGSHATTEKSAPFLSINAQSPLREHTEAIVPKHQRQHQHITGLQWAHLSSSEDPTPSLEIAVSPTILKGFSGVAHAGGRSADGASPQSRGRGSVRRKPIRSEKRKPFARFARWWCCDMNAGPDLN